MDMENLKLLFFFIIFWSSPSANSNKLCPISYCANNTLPIKYPFKLQNYSQTPNCSYTNLSCTTQGAVILNLPNSGDFYVREIYYEYKNPVILLSDPQNCFPKRFIASNSNYSSFIPRRAAYYFLDYTFYSCPPNNVAWERFPTIGCLSNSTSDVVAVRADLRQTKAELRSCNEIFTSSMPVRSRLPPYFLENERNFFLEWNASSCGSCPYKERSEMALNYAVAYYIILFLAILLAAAICTPCICYGYYLIRTGIGCCIDLITAIFRKKFKMKRSNAATVTPLP